MEKLPIGEILFRIQEKNKQLFNEGKLNLHCGWKDTHEEGLQTHSLGLWVDETLPKDIQQMIRNAYKGICPEYNKHHHLDLNIDNVNVLRLQVESMKEGDNWCANSCWANARVIVK